MTYIQTLVNETPYLQVELDQKDSVIEIPPHLVRRCIHVTIFVENNLYDKSITMIEMIEFRGRLTV